MTKMVNYKISRGFIALFVIVFVITVLLVPNSFPSSASATLETGMVPPLSYPVTTPSDVDTNQSVAVMPPQNSTSIAYNKTTDTVEGFSNIVCTSGIDYVLMTGQYTAGNTAYKVIFLRMTLLDNNGLVLATGTGHVDKVDTNKTVTFNAITRYPSTFSSCDIQIDNAIPK